MPSILTRSKIQNAIRLKGLFYRLLRASLEMHSCTVRVRWVYVRVCGVSGLLDPTDRVHHPAELRGKVVDTSLVRLRQQLQ